ncbi:Hsp70 family protein [Clostridium sp. HCP1S3_B4]|uniref:Hsp70 family protein n=1 Tax=unclassified Clostridium TaxID=2614128 RepID=UPI003F8CED41
MKINNEEHSDLCVGIDLGTTNSVLATVNLKPNGDIVSKVVDIPRAVDMYSNISSEVKLSKQKRPLLPSCIYYREEKNYEPLVGDFAKMQYPLRPHLVAKSIKSQMGNNEVEGLSPDIPDKTPAQVSSNILKHLIKNAEKIYRCKIDDAVITVPANFDSAMCKATRDAAELAGIKVKNLDGSERPVLLPEPNAVIYDLINQIHNGEISGHILNLDMQKNVLVFDLGGGTLDITMHQIIRRVDCNEVLKVSEIATNRYTLLGGDDFDELIAEAMFDRYKKQYSSHIEIVNKIEREKRIIMPQLRNYAEQLKIDLNDRCSQDWESDWEDDGWDDEKESDTFSVGGNMGSIGYAYDDSFNKEEIENILKPFMGEHLKYQDYKNIEKMSSINDTRNIIYPILDVLNKASKKLQVETINVDAVIVNGGMSKFYLVIDRLKEFFGFEPIVALDPDQAVARGAAVYHYYLHKYSQIQDDMKLLGNTYNDSVNNVKIKTSDISKEMIKKHNIGIEFGNKILNESLYLGAKNGAVHEIIPTGAELPYQSKVQNGFRLTPGQSIIAIPIKTKNIDGTYRTISSGKIEFSNQYKNGVYVSFEIYMSSSKVLTMNAWTSTDEMGVNKIEEKIGTIDVGCNLDKDKMVKCKFVSPTGSILKAKEEICNIKQLCCNYDKFMKSRNDIQKSAVSKKINICLKSIYQCANPEDFAEPILNELKSINSEVFRERLFVMARKIGEKWDDDSKQKLEELCIAQLGSELLGLSVGGPRTSTNIQAIYTLGMCGTTKNLNKIQSLNEKAVYRQACLYTYAKTRTQGDWIFKQFKNDYKKALKHCNNNLQFSAYAVGIYLRKDINGQIKISQEKVVEYLCNLILSKLSKEQDLICCIIALGYICDQRSICSNILNNSLVDKALEVLDFIKYKYPIAMIEASSKSKNIAEKMINGIELNFEDERYLLEKLEK